MVRFKTPDKLRKSIRRQLITQGRNRQQKHGKQEQQQYICQPRSGIFRIRIRKSSRRKDCSLDSGICSQQVIISSKDHPFHQE